MTVAAVEPYTPPPTSGEMARWVGIAHAAASLADRIAATDFVPEAMRDNPAMVTAAIMYGDELGVGPMQALAGINVIRGKPTPSSELMRALVFRAGHSMRVLKSDGKVCRMAGKRRDEREATVIEWTIDMARAAGLLDGDRGVTWRRYPRAMLLARCTSELCRVMFPDVVKGLGHVADDDATAQGFDEWATAETGTEPEQQPEQRTTTVQRRATSETLPPEQRTRPVESTPLPEEPTPQAMSAPERRDEWPPGTDQPALPFDAPTGRVAGGEPFHSASPPATPEPLPPTDDTEGAREQEPMGTNTLGIVHTLFATLGIGREERAKRLAITSRIVGRQITTSKELTRHEGLTVVRVLNDAATGSLVIEPDPREPYGVAIYPPDEREPDHADR